MICIHEDRVSKRIRTFVSIGQYSQSCNSFSLYFLVYSLYLEQIEDFEQSVESRAIRD